MIANPNVLEVLAPLTRRMMAASGDAEIVAAVAVSVPWVSVDA